eukprot:TCONS_00009717-protein
MKMFVIGLLSLIIALNVSGSPLSENEVQRLEDTLNVLEDDVQKLIQKAEGQKDETRSMSDEVEKRDANVYYSCDFNGICAKDFTISQSDNKKFIWKEQPNFHNRIQDRTTPGGSFMVAEMRNIKPAGQEKAYSDLTSDEITIQGQSCVEFHIAMYTNRHGCDVARVKVSLDCDGDGVEELFRTTDSGYQKWVQVNAEIPAKYANKKCKVVFHVQNGLTDRPHAAVMIDDFKLTTGACKASNDGPFEPERLACNFDTQGACDWKRSGTADVRFSGHRTRTSNTGPGRSFAYQRYPRGTHGLYMYMDSKSRAGTASSLTLTSPLIKTSNEKKCLRMALSMYGKEMGSTIINLIKSDGSVDEVYKQEGNKDGDSQHWFDVSETLPSNQEFKVQIKSRLGGKLSDIGFDAFEVFDGECSSGEKLTDCKFDGNDDTCRYTDESCTPLRWEKKEEFVPKRGQIIGSIRVAKKAWRMSVDIKYLGPVNNWGSIIHFTRGGNCCGRGHRIPGLWLYENTANVHVTSQVGNNGNQALDKEGADKLKENGQFSTLVVEQKKSTADGLYYITYTLDGKEINKMKQTRPEDHSLVTIYGSDPWHLAADVVVKNLIFENGVDPDCNQVCNKPIGDPAYSSIPPETFKLYTNQETAPTRSKVERTLSELTKQWRISLDIKQLATVNGWSNILHATTGHNCCNPGRRVPAIWFFNRNNRLHITYPIGNQGNTQCNEIYVDEGKFNNIAIEQKKVGDEYWLKVFKDNTEVEKCTVQQSIPRSFANVKYYLSDPWYNAANAVIKNVEFQNFERSYPCGDKCKGIKITDVINGKTVAGFNFTSQYCSDKAFVVMADNLPDFSRLACMRFYYRIEKAASGNVHHCHIHRYGTGRSHRLNTVSNEWTKVEETLPKRAHWVGVSGYLRGAHCPTVSIAGFSVTEGSCQSEE